MRSRPTAGQATIEYIAAVALLAAVFLVAAPAVGAPDVGRSVVGQLKHALCLVGGDICTSSDARRLGMAPCPLRSDTTGVEGSLTAFSIEVGGKWTLTVTPQSDGTVVVVRTAGASAGLAGGFGGGLSTGPVKFGASAEGAVRARVQVARGWVFPDAANAQRFLEHSVRNGFDGKRWPRAWQSGEVGGDAGVSLGASAGASRERRRAGGDGDADTDADQRDGDDAGAEDEGLGATGQLAGASAAGQAALGLKRSRDGSTTLYSRVSLEGPELSVAFLLPALTRGRNEVIAEYTRDRAGTPRELVFRTATPSGGGRTVTDIVARLDLRDPSNLAAVRAFLDSPIPWPSVGGPEKQVVMDRIATHGIVESAVSRIADGSRGGAAEFRLGVKFGLGGKRIKIVKRLVEARATVGGGLAGQRLDCLPRPS